MEITISLICGSYVEDQHPDQPEAVDQRGRGADEEGRQAFRDRLLQKQGGILLVLQCQPANLGV